MIRLKGAEDFVCLCFKGNGANLYCYGLSVEDLLKWNTTRPPGLAQGLVLGLTLAQALVKPW